jgi:hypothetical protein
MASSPMALLDRSAAVAASSSIRDPLGRACRRPASRPHQALSFQRRRSCVRMLAQRRMPAVTMTTMAAMTMMTAMRAVAAPDLSRPHLCCRYRLAARPLDPPPYPHSGAAANYRPLNPDVAAVLVLDQMYPSGWRDSRPPSDTSNMLPNVANLGLVCAWSPTSPQLSETPGRRSYRRTRKSSTARPRSVASWPGAAPGRSVSRPTDCRD